MTAQEYTPAAVTAYTAPHWRVIALALVALVAAFVLGVVVERWRERRRRWPGRFS